MTKQMTKRVMRQMQKMRQNDPDLYLASTDLIVIHRRRLHKAATCNLIMLETTIPRKVSPRLVG